VLVLLGVKLTLAEVVVMEAKLGIPGAVHTDCVVNVVVTAGTVPPPAHTACRRRL
jgi:hypothetical protein